MTRKERNENRPLERTIGNVSFYTVQGMCRQIEGRTRGSHLTENQLYRYVAEGCPCFEHSGAVLFEKDLTGFMNWLRGRQPERQKRALERRRRAMGR